MKFDRVGILQIDNERYAIRPLEVVSEYDRLPILTAEIIPNVFNCSNREELLKRSTLYQPDIKRVIFNDPATVVIWEDGSKTVVKCQPGDTYSKETGLALCIAKKYLGNKGNFNEVFKKWIPEEVKNAVSLGGFKVGDTVRVINSGWLYSTYVDWIENNVTNPKDAEKWSRGKYLSNGNIGVIKYLAPHENGRDIVAYVETARSCNMICTHGLEKYKKV